VKETPDEIAVDVSRVARDDELRHPATLDSTT
jgi:hypothetical protein